MAIKTYFQNIADAIRAKGGTVATLTPSEMPQAIADLPSGGGGTLDYEHITDIILKVTRTYSGGSSFSIGEIKLLKNDGTPFSYPLGNDKMLGGCVSVSGPGNNPRFAFMNDPNYSFQYSGVLNVNSPVYLICKLADGVDCTVYSKWCYYTSKYSQSQGNQASDFSLLLSDGTNIKEVDSTTNYTPPTTTKTKAYEGVIQ
jgi:hypothetical protein